MSVYKVEIWEKYILEVDAENQSDAIRIAHNKRLNSRKDTADRQKLSQTNIGKPIWLCKSEENKDE
tara:strand:- start:2062 stop:2259 length:198 start_codon:yes stop_codon:yes gene_type:complete